VDRLVVTPASIAARTGIMPRTPTPNRPGRAIAPGPAWYAAVRPAGNRAIAAAIAHGSWTTGGSVRAGRTTVQRQDEPAGSGPNAPLLDVAKSADARRYYTSQPWRYTPAIVRQLRTSLGLAPVGGVDDALVQAVARFQVTTGAIDDPALVIDGKAGPRTLPRIFEQGLNVTGRGLAYGEEVQAEVIDQWSTFKTAEERRDKLVELVNHRLVAAGVPPVAAVFDTGPAGGGHFNDETWSMAISQRRLEAPTVDAAQARLVTETTYHEARHAEQGFQIARLRAAQGLSARGIATELGIPPRIATLAKGSPL
jgi:hypothetical protein